MASYATDSRIKLVVSLAVENPVRLKTNVLKPSLRWHLQHLNKAPVTRPAEFLRQSVCIERSRVEDLQSSGIAGLDCGNMPLAWTVAGLAGYTRRQIFQSQLVPTNR
jgi:hypothetical protein